MRKTGKLLRRERKRTRSRKTKQNPRVKVLGRVYSDTCFFCNEMKAEWEKLTHKLQPGILLKDIGENYDENIHILNQEYHIHVEANGLPTLFRILQNKDDQYSLEYYTGERTCKLMLKWLHSS